MRFERKYRIANMSIEELTHILESLSYGFTQQFSDRQVNSIYFDDASFSNLHDNLSGISHRSKYRIRWYGEELNHIKSPILEKKIKENQLGFKEHQQLVGFNLQTELKQISKSIPNLNSDLFPVVSVHYKRSYFLSFHKKVRATIDRQITYRQINKYTFAKSVFCDNDIILEIKYEQHDAAFAEQVLNALPFRIGKNSKYVSAVELSWF